MITIRKVDTRNVWALLKLSVNESQKDFVASNTESIVEAYTVTAAGGVALPFGIYEGDLPVGFLMIGYGEIPGEENPSIAKDNYCIWRLMIDRRYQGRGYGRKALKLALDYVKSFPCGPSDTCYLSYEPRNTLAAKLYHSFGFAETGETDGEEIIAAVTLSDHFRNSNA